MTEPGGPDDRAVDHFIVDGVAPPVIGGEPGQEPVPYHDPPTAPIPAAGGEREERKQSWLSRVFRR